jgi:hypothetical protein
VRDAIGPADAILGPLAVRIGQSALRTMASAVASPIAFPLDLLRSRVASSALAPIGGLSTMRVSKELIGSADWRGHLAQAIKTLPNNGGGL